MAHADTVLKEFIRADGSTYHVVCFDPETGERTGALQGQGYAQESAWSRGVAWAVYGMAISYQHTGEKRYLEGAKKAADYFIANLPDDYVPYWDFKAPLEEEMIRDSSAAACAASGLLEISDSVEASEKSVYYNAALKITKSLYENYSAWDEEEEGLLVKGTVAYSHKPQVHIPIIYGDFYFVETLAKLKGQKSLYL